MKTIKELEAELEYNNDDGVQGAIGALKEVLEKIDELEEIYDGKHRLIRKKELKKEIEG